jgi:hypothetical protein
MNSFIKASLLVGGMLAIGAPAFADDPANSGTMTNAHATHKKLMSDCMTQEKSQNPSSSNAELKKTCRQQVKDQMQRMNDAGTMPKSAVPGQSGGQSSSYGSQNPTSGGSMNSGDSSTTH